MLLFSTTWKEDDDSYLLGLVRRQGATFWRVPLTLLTTRENALPSSFLLFPPRPFY